MTDHHPEGQDQHDQPGGSPRPVKARRPPRRRYTEQQFRDAVADPEVRTVADLCRALGIVPCGGNYESLRAFARRCGVDLRGLDRRAQIDLTDEAVRTAHEGARSVREIARALGLPVNTATHRDVAARLDELGLQRPGSATRLVRPVAPGGPKRTYTKDEFLRAVRDPEVRTYAELCSELGLRPRGENYRRLREVAQFLGIDLSRHLPSRRRSTLMPMPLPFDDKELAAAVAASRTMTDAMRRLGADPTSSQLHRQLSRRVDELGLDTSHMLGRGWRRGATDATRQARPLEEYLVEGRYVTSSNLRQRLIKEEYFEHRCQDCGGAEWQGRPIPLELDHINGRKDDNRLENLRVLCPNCHALTPTYRGRNIGNGV